MKVTALARGDIEAVPLSELKEFCRLSSGDIEDASLRRMLRSARTACENWARIAISPRAFRSTFDLPEWKNSGLRRSLIDHDDVIEFVRLRGPVISVEEVTLLSRLGIKIPAPPYGVFATENRLVWDRPQGEILATTGIDLISYRPDVMFDPNSFLLQVDYTAGYPDITDTTKPDAEKLCDAPDDIVEAICLAVADVYENRGTNDTATTRSLPARSRALLKPYWTPVI
jgi:hypothetical protein